MNHATSPSKVAQLLARHAAESAMSEADIAKACGFDSQSRIHCLLKGQMKLPMEKVDNIAAVLKIDAAHLLRLTLCEYMPDLWSLIEKHLYLDSLSRHERELIHAYREVTGDIDARATVIDRDAVLAIVLA